MGQRGQYVGFCPAGSVTTSIHGNEGHPVRPYVNAVEVRPLEEGDREGMAGAPSTDALGPEVVPENGTEEIRKPRPGKIPRAPTQKELEEQLPLHIPSGIGAPYA